MSFPSDVKIQQFIHICSTFLSRNSSAISSTPLASSGPNLTVTRNENFNRIGVHDTFGYIFTGALISCYLCEELGWSVEAALTAFNGTRRPGLYYGTWKEKTELWFKIFF
jgi:hypothetical protein